MSKKLVNSTGHYILKKGTPFTNVYGLARSILALSTFLTLLFNDIDTLFKPAAGIREYPYCSTGMNSISIFCIVPNTYLEAIKIVTIILLLIIISGWRPKITGLIHWWIAFSVQNSTTTLDGGDQVIAVLTFLLIPITLADERKWHWERDYSIEKNRVVAISSGWASILVIRIQVAILYLHSSIAKLGADEWINGTAVYYFLNDPMFGLNPLVRTIIQPITKSWLIVLPTWGTLILQFLLFCGLFANTKTKKILFVLAITMHELFALMLGLVSFSIAMIAALIIFLLPNVHREYKFNYQFNFLSNRKEVK